jgi:hypothetical protein
MLGHKAFPRLTLVVLVFLLGPRLASGTIFVLADKTQLVERADAIALGTVHSVTPRWEGTRIVSDVALDVEQTVKGALPRQVSLVAPGGKVGDVVMRVIDGAAFRVGDRSIVFMTQRDGLRRLLGPGAGKLDVHARGGQELVAWTKNGVVEEATLQRVLGELRTMAQERGR